MFGNNPDHRERKALSIRHGTGCCESLLQSVWPPAVNRGNVQGDELDEIEWMSVAPNRELDIWNSPEVYPDHGQNVCTLYQLKDSADGYEFYLGRFGAYGSINIRDQFNHGRPMVNGCPWNKDEPWVDQGKLISAVMPEYNDILIEKSRKLLVRADETLSFEP